MKKQIKIASAVAAAAVLTGASVVTAFNAAAGNSYGPSRTSYTTESVKSANFGKTPVFNSITDNQYIGDSEFNFTGARLATATDGTRADEIIVDAGKEYIIRLYVHNNNANSTAEGLKTKVNLGGSGTSVTARGYINVNEKGSTYSGAISEYWDDVVFTSSGSFSFHLEYEESHIETGKMNKALGKDIVGSGATIGYSALDGKMPGCFDKAAYVYVKVKVVPDYQITKQVRIADATDKTWKDEIDAQIGDTVEYRIEFANYSKSSTGQVNITDVLPTNAEYISGSTEVKNSSTNGWKSVADGVVGSGVNINTYAPNSNAFVRFKAKIVDNNLKCGEKTDLRNWGKATVMSASDNSKVAAVINDHADAVVTKVCEPTPTPTPTPTPEPTPTPTNEVVTTSTVSEMPTTGPAEVVSGIVGAGALVTSAGYYLASRKELR